MTWAVIGGIAKGAATAAAGSLATKAVVGEPETFGASGFGQLIEGAPVQQGGNLGMGTNPQIAQQVQQPAPSFGDLIPVEALPTEIQPVLRSKLDELAALALQQQQQTLT